jgi:plastocyanin domain-containing protein
MNKTALVIISVGLVVALGIFFIGGSKSTTSTGTQSAQNVEIKDGIQYITIDAKAGYSPKVSTAKAGIPTKLIVKTNGTYDCSASLVIHSLGYQKILPQTGEETIDIGTPKAGQPLQGVCGMGMYNFQILFT